MLGYVSGRVGFFIIIFVFYNFGRNWGFRFHEPHGYDLYLLPKPYHNIWPHMTGAAKFKFNSVYQKVWELEYKCLWRSKSENNFGTLFRVLCLHLKFEEWISKLFFPYQFLEQLLFKALPGKLFFSKETFFVFFIEILIYRGCVVTLPPPPRTVTDISWTGSLV